MKTSEGKMKIDNCPFDDTTAVVDVIIKFLERKALPNVVCHFKCRAAQVRVTVG